MRDAMKYRVLTAAAALWCLAASVCLANGPVWADRTADLKAIETVRLCLPECGDEATVGAEYGYLQQYTKKLDDINFTSGFRPSEGEHIPEDAYLVMTVNETMSETRDEPGYSCVLGMYSGIIIEDDSHYTEHYTPPEYITHTVGPQRVYTQTAEVEYALYEAGTDRPLFRYRDTMQSERSIDENIEETVTDFYAELKTAIKESKKRRKG